MLVSEFWFLISGRARGKVPSRVMLALVLVLAVGVGFSGAQAPALGTYHALVIGNQAYRHLKGLTTPVADATAVADLLRRDYRFANVRLLTNSTRAEMVRALDDLRRALGPKDNLLIYYAGHGWLDREADRGYWLPVDAERDSRANWLSNAEITDFMRALRAKHVLVVADSCYSGTLTRTIGVQPLGAPDLLRLAQKKARTVLTSGGLEPVADVGGGAHSVFARAFLGALRGNPGATDLASLFTGIRRQVLLNSDQTPEYADIRQAGHDGGDFIFARPGASLAVAPPEPPPRAPRPPAEPEVEVVPRLGSLLVRSPREAVEIWLGERRLGESGPAGDLRVGRLGAGSYRLLARARREGFKPWERDVTVTADQTTEVAIDLEVLGPARVVRGDDGTEMVLVPAGEFWMGSDGEGDADEKPRHRVHLDAYYIDKHEVTNTQYGRFMQVASGAAPAYWTEARFNEPRQPVVGVTWHDAEAYCRWAGQRLPTEAEWEKAARGTDGRKYPWGEQWDASRANSNESRVGRPTPVGQYPGGVSPYGALDMAGNVWEWVADWYASEYYKQSPERSPQGPASGQFRVLRGGSWGGFPFNLRTAFRFSFAPDFRLEFVGFRCARGLP